VSRAWPGALLVLCLSLPFLAAPAVPLRVYVADLGPDFVTFAWGRANGGLHQNTIGRNAQSSGAAEIQIDGRTLKTTASSIRVDGLKPDTVYPYSIRVKGEVASVQNAQVRTWPVQAGSLTYFSIGDFGNGSAAQYKLAARMEEERTRLEKSGTPVRFVVAMGDNVYGKLAASGNKDRDWERKFFAPYAATLSAIPFKAILGNHDGNEVESAGDLEVCLDNFFMPGRWYNFTIGGLLEVFALDSTRNQPSGPAAPAYLADGEQSRWLRENMGKPAQAPWRIVWMHHPMFNAGPRHVAFLQPGRHWFDLFRNNGVQAVFSGHEHNLQFSERNAATGGMQFVLSGAGGELRSSNVRRSMRKANIAAWGNQYHFLVISVSPSEITVRPVGFEPIILWDPDGKVATHPLRISSNRQ